MGFFVLISMILQPIVSAAAYDEVSPYPVYRGSQATKNEVLQKLSVKDAGSRGEIYFTVGMGIMSAPNGQFRPNEIMTQAQALAAIIHTTKERDNIKADPEDWKAPYVTAGTTLGIITEEDLKQYENDPIRLFDDPITAEQFSKWLGRSMGQETAYQGAPKKPITRAVAAKAFFDKRDLILPKIGYEQIRGEMLKTEFIAENSVGKKVVTVSKDDQGYANIVSAGDIPIVSRKVTTDPNVLEPGQKVSFYLKNGVVQFANVAVSTSGVEGADVYSGYQNGFLQKIDEKKKSLVLKDYSGKIKTYTLHPNIEYMQMEGNIEQPSKGKPIAVNELMMGQEIQVLVKDNLAYLVRGFIEEDSDQDGYIPPQSRLVAGIVMQVGEKEITLTDSKSYVISPDTLILDEGKIADYREIREGDRVKLHFDDTQGVEISKIEVEGQQRQADVIVRGTVQSYASGRKELSLSNVQILDGDRWKPWVDENTASKEGEDKKKSNEGDSVIRHSYKTIKLKGSIYDGNRKISTNKIKDYKGQDVYALLSKNQNRPAIEKANIRRGAGVSFSDKIKEVNFPGSFINIQTNVVNFTEGTLIVKDGRIVKPGNLEKYATAYVEAGTNKNASLIVMSNTLYTSEESNYPYAIYRGRLYDVFDYSIQLGNDAGDRVYYKMDFAKWNTYRASSEEPRIAYTDQTYIYDDEEENLETGTKGRRLKVKEFREWRYESGRSAGRSSYSDRQVYVVTRDNVAVAILLVKESGYHEVNTHNVMTAKIREIEEVTKEGKTADGKAIKGYQVRLEEVSKYNALKNMFVHQPLEEKMEVRDGKRVRVPKEELEEKLDLTNAVIIRGDRAIEPMAAGNLKGKRIKVLYKQNNTKNMVNNAIAVIVEP